MNRIKQMLILQQQLNDATGGKGWEQGMTNKGKPIDWKRCIYLEAAELVDSYPWKHWKNIDAQPDYDNIKIEIVDIWHFVMSEALRDYKINRKGDLDQLANDMTNLSDFKKFQDASGKISLGIFEQIAVVEKLLKTLFTDTDILNLVNAFYNLSADLGIALNELYKLYIGKNILNQFRQDHGYKEGQYIKDWGGVEDNVVMQNLLAQNELAHPDELYQLLKSEYSKI